jgi:acyl-CoA reductase-like NAD-dependent aldehyde dehydrogenase
MALVVNARYWLKDTLVWPARLAPRPGESSLKPPGKRKDTSMTAAHHDHESPARSRHAERPADYGTGALVTGLRRSFDSGRTRPRAWRVEQLRALQRLLKERTDEIVEALRADLGKPALEGYSTEVGYTLGTIDHTLKHLAKWMAPEKVKTPLLTQPSASHIHKEPLGVVLIIAPWNYPLELAIGPLIGALAAGNCAVVKP